MLSLLQEYNLSYCDNLDVNHLGYTYFHEILGQRSLIDHAFVRKDDDFILLYRVVESVVNLGFHHPVSFNLCMRANDLQQVIEQAGSVDENDERVTP